MFFHNLGIASLSSLLFSAVNDNVQNIQENTDLRQEASAKQPNIIFFLTDDQDLHFHSLQNMSVVQQELIAKGTSFTNHWATVALCCPSRASLLRGQAAHNTNITDVEAPGGNYDKWLVSGENDDYLPFWLKKAGYTTEYIGKFLNGQTITNYMKPPKGWDHVDTLTGPYTYIYNAVVMSENGKRPVHYAGYHQSDVIRAKALARLDHLTAQDKPFYLAIAPTTPHVETPGLPVPLARHAHDFPDAKAPRLKNFNPANDLQQQKVSWIKKLDKLEHVNITRIDEHQRRRIQCLQGVDEMVHDVIQQLDQKGVLNNTYIVFTSDNGYHLGSFRVAAGKSLPYMTDTNLPLIVRGPGVPAGITSRLPGTHLDFAPTFLDIAGVPKSSFPSFLDGRSLLPNWHNPTSNNQTDDSDSKEILNVEFWGTAGIEAPHPPGKKPNSYKSLRIVGKNHAYLYSSWCTHETELYDTIQDPFELHNLVINPNATTKKLIHRLNSLLMVTKSCEQGSCRDPWVYLQPPNATKRVSNLVQALNPDYDDFYRSVPNVHFNKCMQYQYIPNERPFFPANSSALGRAHRKPTDNFKSPDRNPCEKVKKNMPPAGGADQRHVDLSTIMKSAKNLTDHQLGVGCS